MALKNRYSLSSDVLNLAKDLKEKYPKLSDHEALDLALKTEQNELLRLAFVISSSDSRPSGLEAIAIALGYEQR